MLGAAAPAAASTGDRAGADGAVPTRIIPPVETAATSQQCTFPAEPIQGTPWTIQRLLLQQMWATTRGEGVTVAVIDTGVDASHPQLAGAVERGRDLIENKDDGRFDDVGHGTKVAGIIAARESDDTGFVGIAPGATILPIRQNDGTGQGEGEDGKDHGTAESLARAIRYAVEQGADVINISQDTADGTNPPVLAEAVADAVAEDVVVVASAGNNGADGQARTTYPAAYPGVIAVGSSDRNNERSVFSQAGEFVDVVAPGEDVVSTVPRGGHCVDVGTSFSAPYVSGVAALLRAKYPDWSAEEIAAWMAQTAQRSDRDHNQFVGWGVVDPVKALTGNAEPISEPVPDVLPSGAADIVPARMVLGETPEDRMRRNAVYTVAAGAMLVIVISGTAVVLRDRRKAGAAPPPPAGV
ncbi:type VII secretion-associated serine protease mycosin [Allostreptomyces psammosilenae]